jgi:hypothetical protein
MLAPQSLSLQPQAVFQNALMRRRSKNYYRIGLVPSASLLLPLLLLATLGLTIMPLAALPVQGQLVGIVCVSRNTGVFNDTCSPNPLSLGGPPGGSLTVAVNIRGSEGFHGFRVSVRTDPRFITPIGFNLTGTILDSLGPSTIIFSCVNGFGTLCVVDVDGPGVVSLTVQAPPGASTATPTSGRLFAITYNITSIPSNPFLGIFGAPIFFPGPCFAPFGTSVPDKCVDIFNPVGTPFPETDQIAIFR